MLCDLTLKNYRCFADEAPLRIEVRRGFTALVGANNSGKSSLLRFFFELRQLFQWFSELGREEARHGRASSPVHFSSVLSETRSMSVAKATTSTFT
jgi:predicted ATPase